MAKPRTVFPRSVHGATSRGERNWVHRDQGGTPPRRVEKNFCRFHNNHATKNSVVVVDIFALGHPELDNIRLRIATNGGIRLELSVLWQ